MNQEDALQPGMRERLIDGREFVLRRLASLRDVSMLWTSQLVGMGLGFLTSLLAARWLGAREFGQFAFVVSTSNFVAMFFDLGVSIAAGRLVALVDESEEQRRLIGSWFVVLVPLALGYAGFLAGLALVVDVLFAMHVREVVLTCALPAIGLLLTISLRDLLQGLPRRRLFAALYAMPWAGFLGALLLIRHSGTISVLSVSLSYFLATLATTVFIVVALRPSFRHTRLLGKQVIEETRRFGVHAFVARVFGISTFQMDSPMLALFTRDPAVVGLYVLAKGIVTPIALMSRSTAIVLFRRFAREPKIPRLVTQINLLWLAASSIGLAILARPSVALLLPTEFAPVVPLVYVWIVAMLFMGSLQFPNTFLVAKGEGRTLRRMAFWFAGVNVVSNFALIPWLGALGASIASAIAYGASLLMTVRAYQRLAS